MILVLLSFTAKGQSFRIEDFKKNFSKEEWFKASGSISLQGTYYTAKPSYGHDPWNYYLNGNVNFNLSYESLLKTFLFSLNAVG